MRKHQEGIFFSSLFIFSKDMKKYEIVLRKNDFLNV